MAKVLRPTGRKKTFRRRFGKRAQTRVVLAQQPRTTYYSPTSWYPPLPAEMRMSLKLSYTSLHSVANSAEVFFGISCVSPISVGSQYPEGFERMMALYSRAVVDRVFVKVGFTPTAGTETYDGRIMDPFRVIAAVIPWNDFNDSANLTSFALSSYPEAKTAMIGHTYSQPEKVFYLDVDVRKALANTREEHYACRSTLAGAITLPTLNANIGASPMATFMIDNTLSTVSGRTCYVRREIVYHFTFSMRHALPGAS